MNHSETFEPDEREELAEEELPAWYGACEVFVLRSCPSSTPKTSSLKRAR